MESQTKRIKPKPTETEPGHRESSTQDQNHQHHYQKEEDQSSSSITLSSPTTTTTSNPQPTHPKQSNHTTLTLRHEFHILNRQLVKKRDNFFIDGDYYDRLSDLYGDLSEIVQAAPWRTDINEWVENLCVMLLDVFMRLEVEKKEIDGIEGRLWEILVELGGVV